ncbi:MAG: lipoyl synthase [Bacteroidales bacterium]|nr:lipoyl synthase [Bacteroidales bacterium]
MLIKEQNQQKPIWLKTKIPIGKTYLKVRDIVEKNKLHTICTSGNCPNIAECWGLGTATLMILGNICTRSCKFCGVETGKPRPIDIDEPLRVAKSVKLMNLKHCVLTSVDRDDMEDGGCMIWAETIIAIKEINLHTSIEALIPDFNGEYTYIKKIIDAKPEVISHNLETVRRITPLVRSKAEYEKSLNVIKYISSSGIVSKSGIMLGLGEKENEIYETMDDLLKVGCKVFTIGQYLQPSKKHLPVKNFIRPEIFDKYRQVGLKKGFKFVESSPLVRSSYHAEKHVK